MKKKIKILLIIIIELIVLDTLQAKIYNESPFLKIVKTYENGFAKEEKGILVNTYTCMNRKRETIFKWQKSSCLSEELNREKELKYLYELQKQIDKSLANHKDYKNISSTGVDENKKVVIIELAINTEEEQNKVLEMIGYSEHIEFKQGGPYNPM